MQSYMARLGALGLTLCIITTSKNIQIIRHARQCLDVTRLPVISGSFEGRGQWGRLSYPLWDETFWWGKVPQGATLKCSILVHTVHVNILIVFWGAWLYRSDHSGLNAFLFWLRLGLRFNPRMHVQRSFLKSCRIPPELKSWRVSWMRGEQCVGAIREVWCVCVCVLKQLLFLFFGFVRTLAVTQGSVLGRQEFSSLSVGPRDARLAVVTLQIGIRVHERGGWGSRNRLQATCRGMKELSHGGRIIGLKHTRAVNLTRSFNITIYSFKIKNIKWIKYKKAFINHY